jgi:hypothetical protein
VEVETLLFGLARILGVVRQQRGYFMALGVGEIDLRFDSGRRTIALPGDFGAYLRDGERFEAAPLSLAAGDRLDLLWQDERLLAVVHDKIPAAGLAAVSEPPWTRVRSHPQLRRSVAERYPGFDLRDFEVVSRGVSGRVGQLRLNSVSGESFILEGLAVRWTLDLPDTLFTAEPRTVGGDGWVFHGRGRGHGVGMCQVGAYTMALRGNSYREILSHYYSGIELAQLPQATSRAL